ncbi:MULTISPECIES: hypothetical protein [unclassified Massilia]|uniref:hypothetical protein n=1 Tax=unclassified Massilia TaxID=2609279 RepID=UPI00067AA6EF|nr:MULTISPECIES: hypothetical protein [unclassified Massilia]AKU22505.1 hypothetical protein ACZ75_14515 [Massilia sp. NR 4-1]UMR32710.1 hypothetical protein MJ904_11410 [Massilia sp. MB5]UTY56365.1 hypothetical protein HPQ68_03640 [Massilia sp. erpn]
MLKKLGFFVFAMALGSGFALAAGGICTGDCFETYQACLENGVTKPAVCLRNYQYCQTHCEP